MKKLLLLLLLFVFVPIVLGAAPTVTNSSILPAVPAPENVLYGYCNSNDTDSSYVTYDYSWFVGGVINETGTSGNFFWSQNASLYEGTTTNFSYVHFEVFDIEGDGTYESAGSSWNIGTSANSIFGYTWGGTNWSSNSSVVSGITLRDDIYVNIMVYNFSTVSVNTEMIAFWYSGSIDSYFWNGTGWNSSCTGCENGLPSLISGQFGEMFDLDNDGAPEMIISNSLGQGSFAGYEWNGSSWVSNSTLVSGLTAQSALNYLSIGSVDNDNNYDLLITYGSNSFTPTAYEWSGSSWTQNSALVQGIPTSRNTVTDVFDIDGDTKPEVFVGLENGNYDGYSYITNYSTDTNYNIINTTFGVNNGEEWILQCTANDYNSSSTPVNSTQVNVTNNAPTIPNLAVNAVNVTDTLTITAENSTDADGHSITYLCEVYNVNDTTTVYAYNSSCSYTVAVSDAHDLLRIRALATDTYDNSSVNETNITVDNTLPVVSTVNITPSPATDAQNLTASYACSDADGDTCNSTVEYDWFINGNSSGINSNLLDAGNTSTNDSIIASVRVNDSYGYGAWTNSSPLVVGDATPPVINTITFSSQNVNTGSSITITVNCTDFNTITAVKAQITDPFLIKTNKTMSYSTGNLYTISYVPGSEGTYQVDAYCTDGSGNTGVNNETPSFTASSPIGGGGGGGGGGVSTGDVISALGGILLPEDSQVYISPGRSKIVELRLENEAPVSKTLSVRFDGQAKDWLSFEDGKTTTTYELSASGGLTGNVRYLRFVVEVPLDTEFDDYLANIIISDGSSSFTHPLTITVVNGAFGQLLAWLNTELFTIGSSCTNAFSVDEVCEETSGFSAKYWHVVVLLSLIGLFIYFKTK